MGIERENQTHYELRKQLEERERRLVDNNGTDTELGRLIGGFSARPDAGEIDEAARRYVERYQKKPLVYDPHSLPLTDELKEVRKKLRVCVERMREYIECGSALKTLGLRSSHPMKKAHFNAIRIASLKVEIEELEECVADCDGDPLLEQEVERVRNLDHGVREDLRAHRSERDKASAAAERMQRSRLRRAKKIGDVPYPQRIEMTQEEAMTVIAKARVFIKQQLERLDEEYTGADEDTRRAIRREKKALNRDLGGLM